MEFNSVSSFQTNLTSEKINKSSSLPLEFKKDFSKTCNKNAETTTEEEIENSSGKNILKETNIDVSKAESSKQNVFDTKSLRNNDNTYGLEKFRNNVLIIFNQENVKGYKPRLGTDKDVLALKNTFSKFGFKIDVHKDLTKKEIFGQLKVFEEKNFTDYGCVAIAILTHGTNHGYIRAKDSQFNEIEIINCFKTYNKPTLINKPKILIVQACRGYKFIPGVKVQEPGNIRKYRDEDIEQFYTLPVESNMLILHSAYSGNPSYRDERRGSWFIQSLCRKIDRLAPTMDLESIFTEVKREVAIEWFYKKRNRRNGEVDNNKQMPVLTSTLVRKLYLRKFANESNQTEETNMRCGASVSEPGTPLFDFGQCPCFLDHYSYITNCLRNILLADPSDSIARSYLDISDTFKDGVEFNIPKEELTKTICEYLSECAKDKSYYKFIYMYKHGLEN